jgi:nitrilase
MVSSRNVDQSLARVEPLIMEAAASAEFVFLPENFAALGSDNPLAIAERERDPRGPVRSFLRECALRSGCWIFAGTLPVSVRPDGSDVEGGRVRAASLVFDPGGNEVARYDKIHMFDVSVDDNQKNYLESATFEHGTDVVMVDCPIGKVGLTVCYDIRFPELYRQLFYQQADVLSIPSAFTEVTGQAHFKLLMRARAVENSCFTIAACQGGVHDSGRRTYGHSMVVDPWGSVVGELGTGEGVLSVVLDTEAQARLRKDMPFLEQRRI